MIFTRVKYLKLIVTTEIEFILPDSERHPDYDVTLGIDTSKFPKTESKSDY